MDTEKRRFLRFECLLPVEVTKVEDFAGLAEKGRIEDFSREGLRLELNMDFNFVPGSKIELAYSSPGKSTTERASGEVIWSRNEGNRWHLGLKIGEMKPETRSEILDSCYTEWQEKKKARE